MNELTTSTNSDGKRPKKKTLAHVRPRVRARVRARVRGHMREGLPLNGRFPSESVHPVTHHKTARAERLADNRLRRQEAWAWAEATKRSAQRFLVERIISGRAAAKADCTSADLAAAYAAWCRAESLAPMDQNRLLRLAAAKLPKIHGATPARLWRYSPARGAASVNPLSVRETFARGFRGIRIRPLTAAPRNTIADLAAAVDRDGLKVHTRIVESFFRAAVALGWVDLTDTPESPSLRDGENGEARLTGGAA
jgi:hypothetical protein